MSRRIVVGCGDGLPCHIEINPIVPSLTPEAFTVSWSVEGEAPFDWQLTPATVRGFLPGEVAIACQPIVEDMRDITLTITGYGQTLNIPVRFVR